MITRPGALPMYLPGVLACAFPTPGGRQTDHRQGQTAPRPRGARQ